MADVEFKFEPAGQRRVTRIGVAYSKPTGVPVTYRCSIQELPKRKAGARKRGQHG